MRWMTFIIFAYLLLALDMGLRTLWTVGLAGGIAPELAVILMVFVGLWASPSRMAWACLLLGVMVDLLHPWVLSGQTQDLAIVGPMALGYLLGSYICLQARGLVFRDSPITMAAMVFLAGLMAHLVAVAILSMRGTGFSILPWLMNSPVRNWDPAGELYRRFMQTLYTALLALPASWLMFKTLPWWGFDTGHGPGGAR